MSRQDLFDRLLASLHDAMLDDTRWPAADPVDHDGWWTERVEALVRTRPHIRQYVRVRLALVSTRVLGSTPAGLLENTRCGIVQLVRSLSVPGTGRS